MYVLWGNEFEVAFLDTATLRLNNHGPSYLMVTHLGPCPCHVCSIVAAGQNGTRDRFGSHSGKRPRAA